MDEGRVKHASAEEAPSKRVSCGHCGQNMGSGRWREGDPISRSAKRLHCGQNKTCRRRWLESGMRSRLLLHHPTFSSSSALRLSLQYGVMRSPVGHRHLDHCVSLDTRRK